jgi:hypothetical protein
MSQLPKKFTPARAGNIKQSNNNVGDNDGGRSSVGSNASSGTSAGSSALPRSLAFTPSRSTGFQVKAQISDLSKTRSKQNGPTLRPNSSLGVPKANSLHTIPSSPKKTRNIAFDSPSRSPSKPTLSLHADADFDDGRTSDQLVDATIVNELDLSAEFDVAEIAKMLADERARENQVSSEPSDKVLVSVR